MSRTDRLKNNTKMNLRMQKLKDTSITRTNWKPQTLRESEENSPRSNPNSRLQIIPMFNLFPNSIN